MLLVDDAGWGSLIGGVIIGVYNDRNGSFTAEEIPVSFFQPPEYRRRSYLNAAADIALKLITAQQPARATPICICTGFVLNTAAEQLRAAGYDVTRGKITGPLQDKIETFFVDNLRQKYGFITNLQDATTLSKKGLFWFAQLTWLKNGNPYKIKKPVPSRAAQCKTGWPSFNPWAQNLYPVAKKLSAARTQSSPSNQWYNYD